MKHILALIYLIICMLYADLGHAQQLSFKSTSHDFGTIAEQGGDVSHTFVFENVGSSPVVIITAQTSCGCTTPNYSRKPVAAGKAGEITITYDPMYRPGKFAKDVKIITSASAEPLILTITGNVTPRVKTIDEEYPYDMGGGLRIGYNFYNMMQVEQGTTKESLVAYVNNSKKSIELELRESQSSGHLYNKAPKSIAPGERGLFAIGYDMEHSDYYGTLKDVVKVLVDGEPSRYDITCSAYATDRFRIEEFNSSACANIDKRFLKFGNVKRGSTTPKQSFSIENIGVEPLHIRRAELASGVHCSLKAGAKIAPGDIKQVDVWVDTKEYGFGPFSNYITLTVDDAEHPLQRVRITGIIEK